LLFVLLQRPSLCRLIEKKGGKPPTLAHKNSFADYFSESYTLKINDEVGRPAFPPQGIHQIPLSFSFGIGSQQAVRPRNSHASARFAFVRTPATTRNHLSGGNFMQTATEKLLPAQKEVHRTAHDQDLVEVPKRARLDRDAEAKNFLQIIPVLDNQ
jgi:hypothetical protein